MFKTIKDNLQKSKAAVLVEQAFSKSLMPFIIPEGPAKFASKLIESLWVLDPFILDGSTGPKPSPIAVAAAALAQGLIDHRESRVTLGACFGALQSLLREVQLNRFHYALNGPDMALLDIAENVLNEDANRV